MRVALLCCALAAPLLAGCGGSEGTVSGPPPAAPEKIRLTSPAFSSGATLPARFTCDGEGRSPPLRWSGVPSVAKGLALLVEDPDAPGGTFVHWTLYGFGSTMGGMMAGSVPPGAKQGDNSSGKRGWGAPCPPGGDNPHRYVFTLYALSRPLKVGDGAAAAIVRAEIRAAAIAEGQLVAEYGR